MSRCCSSSLPEKAAAQCCTGDNVLVYACSGGSNVGQITNEVAKRLDEEGVGKFYCLAGLGGDIAPMVASARGADHTIAIDGCSVGCARAALDRAQVPISCYLVVTDEGVEKGHHFQIEEQEVAGICDRVRQMLA